MTHNVLLPCRGHAQATGGMVPTDVFPQLLQALNFSEAGLAGTRKRKAAAAGQGTDTAPPTPDPKQRKLTSFFQTAKSEGKEGIKRGRKEEQ